MANDLPQVEKFLAEGANGVAVDVQFSIDGRPTRTSHGFPCSCFRDCLTSDIFRHVLEHLRDITTPEVSGNSDVKLSLIFLNLRVHFLGGGALYTAGKRLGEALLMYYFEGGLSGANGWVVLSVPTIRHAFLFQGVKDVFRDHEASSVLDQIGFDIGSNEPMPAIYDAFVSMGINEHRWIGDGVSNCLLRSTDRLENLLDERDTGEARFSRVYHWTIDSPPNLRTSLRLGVDAIITNRPDRLLTVLEEDEFYGKYRLATPEDRPWTKVILGGVSLPSSSIDFDIPSPAPVPTNADSLTISSPGEADLNKANADASSDCDKSVSSSSSSAGDDLSSLSLAFANDDTTTESSSTTTESSLDLSETKDLDIKLPDDDVSSKDVSTLMDLLKGRTTEEHRHYKKSLFQNEDLVDVIRKISDRSSASNSESDGELTKVLIDLLKNVNTPAPSSSVPVDLLMALVASQAPPPTPSIPLELAAYLLRPPQPNPTSQLLDLLRPSYASSSVPVETVRLLLELQSRSSQSTSPLSFLQPSTGYGGNSALTSLLLNSLQSKSSSTPLTSLLPMVQLMGSKSNSADLLKALSALTSTNKDTKLQSQDNSKSKNSPSSSGSNKQQTGRELDDLKSSSSSGKDETKTTADSVKLSSKPKGRDTNCVRNLTKNFPIPSDLNPHFHHPWQPPPSTMVVADIGPDGVHWNVWEKPGNVLVPPGIHPGPGNPFHNGHFVKTPAGETTKESKQNKDAGIKLLSAGFVPNAMPIQLPPFRRPPFPVNGPLPFRHTRLPPVGYNRPFRPGIPPRPLLHPPRPRPYLRPCPYPGAVGCGPNTHSHASPNYGPVSDIIKYPTGKGIPESYYSYRTKGLVGDTHDHRILPPFPSEPAYKPPVFYDTGVPFNFRGHNLKTNAGVINPVKTNPNNLSGDDQKIKSPSLKGNAEIITNDSLDLIDSPILSTELKDDSRETKTTQAGTIDDIMDLLTSKVPSVTQATPALDQDERVVPTLEQLHSKENLAAILASLTSSTQKPTKATTPFIIEEDKHIGMKDTSPFEEDKEKLNKDLLSQDEFFSSLLPKPKPLDVNGKEENEATTTTDFPELNLDDFKPTHSSVPSDLAAHLAILSGKWPQEISVSGKPSEPTVTEVSTNVGIPLHTDDDLDSGRVDSSFPRRNQTLLPPTGGLGWNGNGLDLKKLQELLAEHTGKRMEVIIIENTPLIFVPSSVPGEREQQIAQLSGLGGTTIGVTTPPSFDDVYEQTTTTRKREATFSPLDISEEDPNLEHSFAVNEDFLLTRKPAQAVKVPSDVTISKPSQGLPQKLSSQNHTALPIKMDKPAMNAPDHLHEAFFSLKEQNVTPTEDNLEIPVRELLGLRLNETVNDSELSDMPPMLDPDTKEENSQAVIQEVGEHESAEGLEQSLPNNKLEGTSTEASFSELVVNSKEETMAEIEKAPLLNTQRKPLTFTTTDVTTKQTAPSLTLHHQFSYGKLNEQSSILDKPEPLKSEGVPQPTTTFQSVTHHSYNSSILAIIHSGKFSTQGSTHKDEHNHMAKDLQSFSFVETEATTLKPGVMQQHVPSKTKQNSNFKAELVKQVSFNGLQHVPHQPVKPNDEIKLSGQEILQSADKDFPSTFRDNNQSDPTPQIKITRSKEGSHHGKLKPSNVQSTERQFATSSIFSAAHVENSHWNSTSVSKRQPHFGITVDDSSEQFNQYGKPTDDKELSQQPPNKDNHLFLSELLETYKQFESSLEELKHDSLNTTENSEHLIPTEPFPYIDSDFPPAEAVQSHYSHMHFPDKLATHSMNNAEENKQSSSNPTDARIGESFVAEASVLVSNQFYSAVSHRLPKVVLSSSKTAILASQQEQQKETSESLKLTKESPVTTNTTAVLAGINEDLQSTERFLTNQDYYHSQETPQLHTVLEESQHNQFQPPPNSKEIEQSKKTFSATKNLPEKVEKSIPDDLPIRQAILLNTDNQSDKEDFSLPSSISVSDQYASSETGSTERVHTGQSFLHTRSLVTAPLGFPFTVPGYESNMTSKEEHFTVERMVSSFEDAELLTPSTSILSESYTKGNSDASHESLMTHQSYSENLPFSVTSNIFGPLLETQELQNNSSETFNIKTGYESSDEVTTALRNFGPSPASSTALGTSVPESELLMEGYFVNSPLSAVDGNHAESSSIKTLPGSTLTQNIDYLLIDKPEHIVKLDEAALDPNVSSQHMPTQTDIPTEQTSVFENFHNPANLLPFDKASSETANHLLSNFQELQIESLHSSIPVSISTSTELINHESTPKKIAQNSNLEYVNEVQLLPQSAVAQQIGQILISSTNTMSLNTVSLPLQSPDSNEEQDLSNIATISTNWRSSKGTEDINNQKGNTVDTKGLQSQNSWKYLSSSGTVNYLPIATGGLVSATNCPCLVNEVSPSVLRVTPGSSTKSSATDEMLFDKPYSRFSSTASILASTIHNFEPSLLETENVSSSSIRGLHEHAIFTTKQFTPTIQAMSSVNKSEPQLINKFAALYNTANTTKNQEIEDLVINVQASSSRTGFQELLDAPTQSVIPMMDINNAPVFSHLKHDVQADFLNTEVSTSSSFVDTIQSESLPLLPEHTPSLLKSANCTQANTEHPSIEISTKAFVAENHSVNTDKHRNVTVKQLQESSVETVKFQEDAHTEKAMVMQPTLSADIDLITILQNDTINSLLTGASIHMSQGYPTATMKDDNNEGIPDTNTENVTHPSYQSIEISTKAFVAESHSVNTDKHRNVTVKQLQESSAETEKSQEDAHTEKAMVMQPTSFISADIDLATILQNDTINSMLTGASIHMSQGHPTAKLKDDNNEGIQITNTENVTMKTVKPITIPPMKNGLLLRFSNANMTTPTVSQDKELTNKTAASVQQTTIHRPNLVGQINSEMEPLQLQHIKTDNSLNHSVSQQPHMVSLRVPIPRPPVPTLRRPVLRPKHTSNTRANNSDVHFHNQFPHSLRVRPSHVSIQHKGSATPPPKSNSPKNVSSFSHAHSASGLQTMSAGQQQFLQKATNLLPLPETFTPVSVPVPYPDKPHTVITIQPAFYPGVNMFHSKNGTVGSAHHLQRTKDGFVSLFNSSDPLHRGFSITVKNVHESRDSEHHLSRHQKVVTARTLEIERKRDNARRRMGSVTTQQEPTIFAGNVGSSDPNQRYVQGSQGVMIRNNYQLPSRNSKLHTVTSHQPRKTENKSPSFTHQPQLSSATQFGGNREVGSKMTHTTLRHERQGVSGGSNGLRNSKTVLNDAFNYQSVPNLNPYPRQRTLPLMSNSENSYTSLRRQSSRPKVTQ